MGEAKRRKKLDPNFAQPRVMGLSDDPKIAAQNYEALIAASAYKQSLMEHFWAALAWFGFTQLGEVGIVYRCDPLGKMAGKTTYLPLSGWKQQHPEARREISLIESYDPAHQLILVQDLPEGCVWFKLTPRLAPPKAHRTWKGNMSL